MPDQQRKNILVKGWFRIPHSYAIVNCFQLLSLYKRHSDKFNFYTYEDVYYYPTWKPQKLVFSEKDNKLLRDLLKRKLPPDTKIDLVYSITYPYDINSDHADDTTQKCVFYTAEFSRLEPSYFFRGTLETALRELYFTCPSKWSWHGMDKLGLDPKKNMIIPHGVSSEYMHLSSKDIRSRVRKFYSISDQDILFINIGSMTGNKGIGHILHAIQTCKNVHGKSNFKLLLKGSQDLYDSKSFISNYLRGVNLDDSNLIIINDTLSHNAIRWLFTAADVYISPYIAEGFNMTVLEALSCGLSVIVPETGSTEQFIADIEDSCPEYIIKLESKVMCTGTGLWHNDIQTEKLTTLLLTNEERLVQMKTKRYELYPRIRAKIDEIYSWDVVSDRLAEYFTFILDQPCTKPVSMQT